MRAILYPVSVVALVATWGCTSQALIRADKTLAKAEERLLELKEDVAEARTRLEEAVDFSEDVLQTARDLDDFIPRMLVWVNEQAAENPGLQATAAEIVSFLEKTREIAQKVIERAPAIIEKGSEIVSRVEEGEGRIDKVRGLIGGVRKELPKPGPDGEYPSGIAVLPVLLGLAKQLLGLRS